jgi:hypothetical protein
MLRVALAAAAALHVADAAQSWACAIQEESWDNSRYAVATCPGSSYDYVITSIDFANYGNARGTCGAFFIPSVQGCSRDVRGSLGGCVLAKSCSVSANNGVWGDPCPGVYKQVSRRDTGGGGRGGRSLNAHTLRSSDRRVAQQARTRSRDDLHPATLQDGRFRRRSGARSTAQRGIA